MGLMKKLYTKRCLGLPGQHPVNLGPPRGEKCEVCGDVHPKSRMKLEDTGNGVVYLCRQCVPVKHRTPKPVVKPSHVQGTLFGAETEAQS